MLDRRLRVVVLAALSAALLPLLAGAADDRAAALLAKHAAYAGWIGGDGKISSLRMTGEATRDGQIVSRFSALRRGVVYRDSTLRSGGSFENGFTGRVFWHSNVNGFTTQIVGDVVPFLATQIQIDDEALTGLPATIRGTETIAGVSTTIVRVVAQAGLPVDLSIDPDTGAFKRIALDPDGKYEQRFDVLGDTDVGGGKRILSAWRAVGGRTIFTWTKIEANAEVTPEELHPPKQVATWTFGPPTQTVPIAVTDSRIFLDAVVNGHPGHFVFDTGANGIFFTDAFARTVGAKPDGTTRITGIGGGARANVYRVDTLAFGASVLHDVAIETGLDERGESAERIDGLIGFDLLAGAIVELDLDAQTLRLHDPASVAPDLTQGVTARVDLTSGQPRIPMIVSGRIPVIAMLDSGGGHYALFSPELVARKHLILNPPANALAAKLRMIGVNGSEVDDCGRLESLEVGPIVYRPVPACSSSSMSSNEILVGFDFFKNFNYVFDFPDAEIVMSARKTH